MNIASVPGRDVGIQGEEGEGKRKEKKGEEEGKRKGKKETEEREEGM